MPYGLRESDMPHILDSIQRFEEITEVVLFGSRAKGNYKVGSDVDLAIKGDRISHRTVTQLHDWLNDEIPLPYFFDVVQYETIDEPKLKEHIDRVGVVLFRVSPSIALRQKPDLRSAPSQEK
jgi:uncharacterized protein